MWIEPYYPYVPDPWRYYCPPRRPMPYMYPDRTLPGGLREDDVRRIIREEIRKVRS